MFLVGNQRDCLALIEPLHTAFLHSIKLSGYKMAIKVDNFSCRIKQLLGQSCKCSDYL